MRSRRTTGVLVDHASWRVPLAEWKRALRPALPAAIQARHSSAPAFGAGLP
jgi:hypothetical protein